MGLGKHLCLSQSAPGFAPCWSGFARKKKPLLFPSCCISCEQPSSSLICRQPQGYSLGVWEFNQALLGHVNSAWSRRSHGGERLLQIFGLACLGWGLGWLGTQLLFRGMPLGMARGRTLAAPAGRVASHGHPQQGWLCSDTSIPSSPASATSLFLLQTQEFSL